MDFEPFKDAVIEDFAAQNLCFVDDFTRGEKNRHREIFAEAIKSLPPWQQILMMQTAWTNHAGRHETISKLWPQGEVSLSGFFAPGPQYHTMPDGTNFRTNNGIFWSADSANDAIPVIFHEHSHRIDRLLNFRFSSNLRDVFFTFANDAWREAVDSYIAQDADAHLPSPYEGYVRIVDCLHNYRNEKDILSESFAEANTLYCMLYRMDSARLPSEMNDYLPHIWQAYDREIRPKGEILAAEMLRSNLYHAP